MKKIICIFMFMFISIVSGQITYIPDPGFESILISLGIDTDGEINGQVLTSDIEDETELYLSTPMNIVSDITGIEDFTSLQSFEISQQNVTNVDLSSNSNLTALNLSTIPLESLNIYSNISLVNLTLTLSGISPLSTIDLTNNINLEYISISGSSFVELDLNDNELLQSFILYGNIDLFYINLQNGNNENAPLWNVQINFSNENVICVQVDDPEAVMAGDPPYQFWEIDESITISDDCGVFDIDDNRHQEFSVYPNPVKDFLRIDNNTSTEITSIKMYDVMGRYVLNVNEGFDQIDVSHLSSGVLFIEIETDQGTITKKIIKE